MSFLSLRVCALAAASASLLLAGCGVGPLTPAVSSNGAIKGSVHGGEQPISGVTVQLYAVGTGGDGSPSSPLLTSAVMSDANGNFSITGDYTCPSATALVYLVGTGGNPGLGLGRGEPLAVRPFSRGFGRYTPLPRKYVKSGQIRT